MAPSVLRGTCFFFPFQKAVTRERHRRCRRTRMEDWANSSGRRKRLPSCAMERLLAQVKVLHC